jgi:hypothetical protein
MIENLKDKLEEAQSAVETLEEPFKTIAFEKILNKLMGDSDLEKKKAPKKQKKRAETGLVDEETQQIINSLNRTEFPIIKKIDKSLDLALYMLKEMEKRGYDSLSPSQIAAILKGVFRKKINQPAVAMALFKADEYTHRIPFTYKGGKSYKYKLMERGEEYIDSLIKNFEEDDHVTETNEGGEPDSS